MSGKEGCGSDLKVGQLGDLDSGSSSFSLDQAHVSGGSLHHESLRGVEVALVRPPHPTVGRATETLVGLREGVVRDGDGVSVLLSALREEPDLHEELHRLRLSGTADLVDGHGPKHVEQLLGYGPAANSVADGGEMSIEGEGELVLLDVPSSTHMGSTDLPVP